MAFSYTFANSGIYRATNENIDNSCSTQALIFFNKLNENENESLYASNNKSVKCDGKNYWDNQLQVTGSVKATNWSQGSVRLCKVNSNNNNEEIQNLANCSSVGWISKTATFGIQMSKDQNIQIVQTV